MQPMPSDAPSSIDPETDKQRSESKPEPANDPEFAAVPLSKSSREIRSSGYRFLPRTPCDERGCSDLAAVQASFDVLPRDPKPGRRSRAHSRFILRTDGELLLQPATGYSQPAEYNPDEQGKVRHFAPIDKRVLYSATLQYLFARHQILACEAFPELFLQPEVRVDLHQIRYEANAEYRASYSSPMEIHHDPEVYVAVVLMKLSPNAIGGENPISFSRGSHVDDVIRLERPLETLVLATECWHGLSPLGTRDGQPATRDVFLLTFN